MNTLHLYHWLDIQTLSTYLPIIGKGDSLVIYGELDQQTIDKIAACLTDVTTQWHLVFADDRPNMNTHQINNAEWLRLIISHKNTLSWK